MPMKILPQCCTKHALTIEDMNEAMDFIPPLRISDCSQFVTGAGAVVIANERVASSLNTTPVWLLRLGSEKYYLMNYKMQKGDEIVPSHEAKQVLC